MGTPVHDFQARMARWRIRQSTMASRLGICQPNLSRFIRGERPWPPGLEKKALAELSRLEAAERAAQEARSRSLSDSEGRGVGLWAVVSWFVLSRLRRASDDAREHASG